MNEFKGIKERKKKSMKYVITKTLEYYSVIEELQPVNGKKYLCRVAVNDDYGRFYICYQIVQYLGDEKWYNARGIVTHWAEIPEVYDIDDNKIL